MVEVTLTTRGRFAVIVGAIALGATGGCSAIVGLTSDLRERDAGHAPVDDASVDGPSTGDDDDDDASADATVADGGSHDRDASDGAANDDDASDAATLSDASWQIDQTFGNHGWASVGSTLEGPSLPAIAATETGSVIVAATFYDGTDDGTSGNNVISVMVMAPGTPPGAFTATDLAGEPNDILPQDGGFFIAGTAAYALGVHHFSQQMVGTEVLAAGSSADTADQEETGVDCRARRAVGILDGGYLDVVGTCFVGPEALAAEVTLAVDPHTGTSSESNYPDDGSAFSVASGGRSADGLWIVGNAADLDGGNARPSFRLLGSNAAIVTEGTFAIDAGDAGDLAAHQTIGDMTTLDGGDALMVGLVGSSLFTARVPPTEAGDAAAAAFLSLPDAGADLLAEPDGRLRMGTCRDGRRVVVGSVGGEAALSVATFDDRGTFGSDFSESGFRLVAPGRGLTSAAVGGLAVVPAGADRDAVYVVVVLTASAGLREMNLVRLIHRLGT